ncbi:class I SAM-dependent methyltransferase [Sandaracinobacter neustonicus]|uniref:Class I SAM-dependent methyltransferase n=1 Tax=Sandaracinobacter neustonicus TaxID=1715348 RepID=A0A501XL53_9SPHN|nr:class I SAM-dependent methyltransferase [Sandaracinobacter neustonicus]
MRTLVAAVLAVTAMTPSAAQTKAEAATAAKIDAALAGPQRSEANRARDPYRHPKETLLFFGLRPEMTVVEVTPGGGWYSEILGPVLAAKGRYVAAHNNPMGSPNALRQRASFIEKLKANPELYGNVAVTSFGKGIETNLAAPGSADMVLTFRNVHNWLMADFAADAFKAFYGALKPGGVLGVVEHRMPEDRPDTEESRRTGYVKQSEVIRLAEAAGFKYVGSSEVNANPKDKADHPKGVWTLPPTYAMGDTDKATYAAIGESDRMTLKFVKPAN